VDSKKQQDEMPDRDPLAKREILELAKAYYRIPDAQVRRKLFDLVKTLANLGASGSKLP
jgi:hypothetical protein